MLRLFLILLLCPSLCLADEIDVLLKQGTIYDGNSITPLVGDVAIRDGKILAVGSLDASNAKVIVNCSGKIICPGFIDLHNHSDKQVVSHLTRANINYLLQGCTTVVTGNCGSGPVDVAKYYGKINAAGCGTNVVHLLPQGDLRRQVMGSERRKPTGAELTKMQSLADKAMRDGAWGMSTGLIYVPSSYAETTEIITIAKVVADHGGIYASHIRGEGSGLLDSIREAIQIGLKAELPVHVSHFKSSGKTNWGQVRAAANLIERARLKGQQVTADQYPYRASSTSLHASLIPAWARAGGRKAMLERFDDKEDGKRIRDAIQLKLKAAEGGKIIRIARCYKQEWVGKNLAAISESAEKPALQIVEIIERNGGAQVVKFNMSPEDIRYVMTLEWVATASDGRAYLPGADKPHPRSYGTFPRKISLFAQQEKVLSVGAAIRSATGLPAKILGIKDRGTIAPGFVADLAVLDPRTLADKATFDDPHRYCEGISYVLLGGEFSVYRGKATGALHGRAIEKPPKND